MYTKFVSFLFQGVIRVETYVSKPSTQGQNSFFTQESPFQKVPLPHLQSSGTMMPEQKWHSETSSPSGGENVVEIVTAEEDYRLKPINLEESRFRN